MIEKLRETARKVRQHVRQVREGGPMALQRIQEAATEAFLVPAGNAAGPDGGA